MMRDLTWRQVIARRLARSRLVRPAPRTRLVDVVRETALIQAQVAAAAELGLSARVRGLTRAHVHDALYRRRDLVRTWSLRGTMHLVPADEVALWAAAANGGERYWESRAWLAENGLTPRRGAALFEAIGEALRGACLTRAELAAAVEERLGWTHPKLMSGYGQLLHPSTVTGALCFGPPRGASATFVRADEWLGGWRDADPQAARREVLERFVRAYGPTKATEFASWSGFGRDAARELFAEADLEEVKVEGARLFVLRGDADFDEDGRSVRLVPEYDAYVLASRPRDPFVPEPAKERIKRDPKGRLETVTGVATLLVDGVVTGLWRRRGGVVDVEQVLPLPRGRKVELDAEVERVQAFLNG
jgi:hypothetical protein